MGGWVDGVDTALLTDLYELTMAASYVEQGMEDDATFDLYVRELPPQRSFLVACGIEPALQYLEALHFDDEAVAYVRSLGRFDDAFLARLRRLRFTGDVWAVGEGEVVFAGEPLLRVSAPLPEAQLVETFLLATVSFETMVATKAARMALACGDRPFVDFSARRDHGAGAALQAARAAYVGGAAATSNVLAGKLHGIPLSGTMAHSYVMAFPTEADAFRAFARLFPDDATLLVDTYDTIEGARRAVDVARELAGEGIRLRGVRLDSGDLVALSRAVRAVLDEGGQQHVRIFASGDLDEHRIVELLAAGAPIDAFGVGTQLGTSGDAPSVAAVYKLAESSGPKRKLARGKATLPGRKQVWRVTGDDDVPDHDVIAKDGEQIPGGTPLLRQVMAGGRRTSSPEPLGTARGRCRCSVAALPAALRELDPPAAGYRVALSEGIEALIDALDRADGPPA